MKNSKKIYILCNISLLMAAMISGLSFVAQKAGMNYVGPFTFNVLRSLIGSLSLVPVILLQARIADTKMTQKDTKRIKSIMERRAACRFCIIYCVFNKSVLYDFCACRKSRIYNFFVCFICSGDCRFYEAKTFTECSS